MKAIALDASHTRFVLAEGTDNGKDVSLSRVLTVDIPTGSVADGIISDLSAVRSALEVALKANKVRTKPVVVTVNSNTQITRRLDVPQAKDKDMPNLVEMEMRQFLPTGRPYIVDYVTLGETVSAHGSTMVSVKASALPAELCEGYYRLLSELHLRPHKLDVHQQVLGKLFSPKVRINMKDIGNRVVVAVDLGNFQTTLTVVIQGEVDLTRSIPVGLNNMERMVADRMQGTPEEARQYIRQRMDVHREQTDAADSARRFYGQIITEIRKIQQYIRAKNIQEPTMVFLYGVGSGLNGLDAFLSESLETETETVNQHSRIHMPPDDRTSPLANYLQAAGALLRS